MRFILVPWLKRGFQKSVGSHYLSTTTYLSGLTRNQPDINNNEFSNLQAKVRNYVQEKVAICQPDKVHICDGSEAEYNNLIKLMVDQGMLTKLRKYENCWLSRTDPADVARVESLTFISTKEKRETVPTTKEGVKGTLGNWMSPDDMSKALGERLPGCMRGRTMYIIPFSMGPVGSPLSKIGIEITDSPYVVASMRIMTRMGTSVLKQLGNDDFVKCLHSVGQPIAPGAKSTTWPCNPSKTLIAHIPERNEIASFGSGYGGNSLLGKKCFALRLGSILAKREGWFAEHMLILGITNPKGEKKFIAAAFPSACGKTNLAMMNPSLEGYKIECVGDDIAWMRFNDKGELRAINPEAGFFGVAPGTSDETNPNAMATITRNTIFTNVGETQDGDFYWEGLEHKLKDPNIKIKSWLGQEWTPGSGKPAAHPNSRFCTPASQCPVIDPSWEDPNGVPISAIIFGGRRPTGVPLVYEAYNWEHGVFIGSAMRSEATAAAEYKGKVVMHDPFAMRPFFGYNFGHYLSHWLSFGQKPNLKVPKIFHVNWFRKSDEGKFLWPGFGENSRVLDWIIRRVNNEDVAEETPVGYIPKEDAFNLEGLKEQINMKELFRLPKDFWLKECDEIAKYYDEQVGEDLPPQIRKQLELLKDRFSKVN